MSWQELALGLGIFLTYSCVPVSEGSRLTAHYALAVLLGHFPSLQVITNLVKMLKARDTRRSFCPPNHWLSEQEDIRADKVPWAVTQMPRQ